MRASSSQRILSLWLARLSTDRLARRSREALSPLVVYGKRGNADVLVAVDAAAERLALRRNMALAQARAMHPDLAAVPEDAAADAHLIDAIADWCGRYTPLVAADPPDGILLDIGGCAHLFGGEEKLRDDLAARMHSFGFTARAAIAPTIGAAFAAAHFGRTISQKAGIAEGEEREALAPLPLAALRLSPETVAALARVGLKRIGDIVDMPRAPLAARFGADLIRQLDRALGREHEPLSPRLPIAPYVAEQMFAEPIAREEDVLATVERLAARLKMALAALAMVRAASSSRCSAPTARSSASRRAPRGRCAIRRRSARCSSNGSPRSATRSIPASASISRGSPCSSPKPCPNEQIGLGGGDDGEIDRLVDRLSARLGARRVRA